jgi:hypothetical protein
MNTLNTPVVVAHPETGKLITRFTTEAGKEYGKIRIDQTELVMSNGFSRFAKRSAFITVEGETADILEGMLTEGNPYPMGGKIVVTESTRPFYPNQTPKTKGAGGEVILSQGHPVYRDTEFTSDMSRADVFLTSDSALNGMNTANAGNAAE